MEYLTQLFLPVSIWFQQIADWLIPIMKGITFLGNIEFYLMFMPLLYWCLDITLGIRIGIMLLVSGGINAILKQGFQSPRPFWVSSQVQGLSEGTSFGFPSGHAQNAASIWGLLALSLTKRWVKTFALVGILLIGLSRVFLGVHFLHDVLVGWLVGALLLYLFIRLEPGVVSWFKQNSSGRRILLLITITSLFILPVILITPPFNPPSLPSAWLETAGLEINPYSYDDILTSAGAFFGLGLGIILFTEKGFFTRKGTIWQLIMRYLIGIAGVLLLYLGLGKVFPDDLDLISYLLRFVRYSLIGLWISFGAPVIFSWLKLTEIKKE
jgi:membrane-associated phospholipid phosphatase